jgi:outer membrane protein
MIKKWVLLACLSFGASAQAADVQNLIDIYQAAVQHDPTLASAISSNKASQEYIEQAKANYRPKVNFSAGVTSTRSDVKIIGSTAPLRGGINNYSGYNYALEASQPIYRKENLVQIEQSEVLVKQSDKQLYLSRQDLMLKITQAYFDVLLAQDKISLIQAQKAAILSQLEQAKVTFEVGTATITDVNEAQARYDLVVAQQISAENDLQIAKRAMQAITGAIPEALASVNPQIKTTQLKQPIAEWQSVALTSNINVQIQEDALKLAEQNVEIAKAGHLPTLDAVASFTDNYANSGANGFGNDSNYAAIGLRLALPIYQGGGISSKVRQSSYNQQKAKDDLEIARRQADLETQRAYLNLNSSIAQVSALEQALKSSQSQLDSTKLGYEVGVRTSVDVLNAQQQFYSANKDLLEARYNYLVNIIRLKYASGILNEEDLNDINQQLVNLKKEASNHYLDNPLNKREVVGIMDKRLKSHTTSKKQKVVASTK